MSSCEATGGPCGLRKMLQIEKKRTVAVTNTAVSEPLDAFGNRNLR